MSQSNITMVFVVSTLVLLIGWLLHSHRQKKNIASLCEQIAQDRFYMSLLNTVLHDILNPIVAAKYSLENLKNQADENLLPYVDNSMTAIEQLSLLVQRIRDMRAFDTGKKSLQFSTMGVNKILSTVENTFRDRTRAKGIRLSVRKDRRRSRVDVDPIIFTSYVLNNLVDNAIKFSSAGTTIEIAGYTVGADIEFIVKDQGAGMSEESVGRLLEGKFEDICPSPPDLKGLGIGMRQVATYLELAGGSVQVESRTKEQSPNDHGTVYKIKIPKVQPPEKAE